MQFNTLSRELFSTISRDVLYYTTAYLNKSDALMSEDEEFVKAVEMNYTTIKKQLFSGSDFIWSFTKARGKIILDKNIDKKEIHKLLPPDFLALLKYDRLTNSLIVEPNIYKVFHNFYSANPSPTSIDIFYIKYIRDASDIEIPDYINQYLGAKLALELGRLPRFISAGIDINSIRLKAAMLYNTAQIQDEKAHPFLLDKY
jgi:hypothetical protein